MDVSKLKSFTLEINGQYKAVYHKDEADDVINGLLSKLHQESHAYDILYYRHKKLEEAAEKLKEKISENENSTQSDTAGIVNCKGIDQLKDSLIKICDAYEAEHKNSDIQAKIEIIFIDEKK